MRKLCAWNLLFLIFFVVFVQFVKTCELDRCKLYLVVLSALILSIWQEVWIVEYCISIEASNMLQWQGSSVVLKRFGIQNRILQSSCTLCIRRICQVYVFTVYLFIFFCVDAKNWFNWHCIAVLYYTQKALIQYLWIYDKSHIQ